MNRITSTSLRKWTSYGLTSFAALFCITTTAQTDYFVNGSGGDWNNGANWDLDFGGVNIVPGVGTNADISSGVAGVTVNYNGPMSAPSFGSLTIYGNTLNVNAAGFNQDLGGFGDILTLDIGVMTVGAGGVWHAVNGGPVNINTLGELNVSGTAYIEPAIGLSPLNILQEGVLTVSSGGAMTLANGIGSTVGGRVNLEGGSLVLTNSGTMSVLAGASIGVTNGSLAIIETTNSPSLLIGENNSTADTALILQGGTVSLSTLLDIKGRATAVVVKDGTLNCLGGSQISETSNDGAGRIEVNGGVANIGDFRVSRVAADGGLVVNGGEVNATSLQIGYWNSRSYATINGGVVTNTGSFTICDRVNGATSSDRRPRFLIRGGTVVSTDAAGIIVANQSNESTGGSASSIAGILDINSGVLMAEGITLVRDDTLTNAHGVFNLSGSGLVYLGATGLTGNVGPINTSYAVNLSGGTLAAQTSYEINANVTLTGTEATLLTADEEGNPFDITANGVVSGSGVLNKTGSGTLTLNANNTYSGNTIIEEGTLALGAAGSIAGTLIEVKAGATFDVSAVAPYAITSGQTLAGNGNVAGNVVAGTGANISAGASAGVLTFANNLALQEGAVTSFEVSGATNDLVIVDGTLDISGGVSTLLVSSLGGAIPGGTYTLFQYGTLNGSIANLSLVGVAGALTNDAVAKTISVITEPTRGPTNITWVGNGTANVWDVLNSTNWLNAGSLDFFVPGDAVRFDATGSANPAVDITEIVQPGTILVDSSSDYSFSGTGWISGGSGLTKTNSGTLTVTTVNDFTGPTVLAGGVFETPSLDIAGAPSGIGAASSDSANLVFDSGALRYTGLAATTDRGATLNAGGGTLDVVDETAVVTLTGTITGPGSLTKQGAGRLDVSSANSYAGGTVVQEGVLRQVSSSSSFGSGALTLTGTANPAVFRFGSDQVTLASPLNVVGDNNFTENRGNNTINNLTGDGTLNLGVFDSGTTFTIAGDMTTFSGTLVAAGIGNLRLHPSTGSSNATFNLGTGTCYLNNRNGVTAEIGALIGGPDTSVQGQSSGSGTSTYRIGGKNLSTVFEGTISESSTSRILNIVKTGTGTLTLAGEGTYTGTTMIEQGELKVNGGLLNTPSVDVNAGATLSGDATIGGILTVNFDATLSPGNSIGAMVVSNSVNLYGNTVMEIASPNSADKLTSPSTYLSGTLIINNIGGNLKVGDTFDLFDGQVIDGLPNIQVPDGVTFDTSLLFTDGTITVTSAPAVPEIEGVVVQGDNIVASGRGGTPSANYVVLTSEDVEAPVGTWTPVQTNMFGPDGSFSFTNVINPAITSEFFQIEE